MAKQFKLDSSDRTDDITHEEVKNLETFKDWNEEKIAALISAIKVFSEVVYSNWSGGKKVEEEIVLNSESVITIKIAA
jgi:hypothetical protein